MSCCPIPMLTKLIQWNGLYKITFLLVYMSTTQMPSNDSIPNNMYNTTIKN